MSAFTGKASYTLPWVWWYRKDPKYRVIGKQNSTLEQSMICYLFMGAIKKNSALINNSGQYELTHGWMKPVLVIELNLLYATHVFLLKGIFMADCSHYTPLENHWGAL